MESQLGVTAGWIAKRCICQRQIRHIGITDVIKEADRGSGANNPDKRLDRRGCARVVEHAIADDNVWLVGAFFLKTQHIIVGCNVFFNLQNMHF